MNRNFILPVLAAGAAGVLAFGTIGAQEAGDAPAPAAQAQTQQWEHLALVQSSALPGRPKVFAEKIQALGREGWELVCVSPITNDGTTTGNTYYFKRPL